MWENDTGLLGFTQRGLRMASSVEYLEHVPELLADVSEVSTRKMMGEYLLYSSGKLFGGVYDDRPPFAEVWRGRGIFVRPRA